ncbi:MAG: hypothetical protein NC904_06370, partial [Candidatus Omnitrophica bacterium]|nr:hypothetical protein [Candidatus Omnitrophota bacterium]
EKIKEDLNVLQIEKVNREGVLKVLEEERGRLIKDLGNRDEEITQLKDKIQEFRYKIGLQELELRHREDELKRIEKDKDNLVKEKENFINEINILKEKIAQWKIENVELRIENKILLDKTKELEEMRMIKINLEERILNLSKEIESLNNRLRENVIRLKEREDSIFEKDKLIESINVQIKDYRVKLDEFAKSLSGKDEDILRLNRELESKNRIIEEKDLFINRIFNSRTYRYLARPLWLIADFIKGILKLNKRKRILVIKPYYVSLSNAENALREIRDSFKDAEIILLANLFKLDYERIKINQSVDRKILFTPDYKDKRLSKWRLLNLLFRLSFCHIDETIILIGPPIYHGYRKAKLLAFFSGAKTIKLFFTENNNLVPFYYYRNLFNIIKVVFQFLWRTIVFWLIILFFIIFVILPIKIKRLFQK